MIRPHPVLLLARHLDLGGSERQLAEIARCLDRRRFEPHVAVFRPGGKRAAELAAEGIPLLSLDLFSLRPPESLLAAHRLVGYIRRHGIELLHAFDAPACIYAGPLARAFSSCAVLSSQRAHRDLVWGWGRHLLRVTDRLVDGVVVNCRFVQEHLVSEEKVPAGLIHLCYNGVDTGVFQPGSGTSADPVLRVGVVCALRPEKQLDVLLEAFARIRRFRENLELLIVGDGPCLSELRARAEALRLTGSCTFQPAVADVAHWLRRIAIFVLPSRSEALSNALMEAMACGCCTVASRVGGNPELVRDGETGLLFEPGNPVELAARLQLLLDQESLRRQLAAAGQRLMRDSFSLQHAACRMGEIYAKVLENRP